MDLSGKLLIAMPGVGDPRFEHSVVFLCAHSDDGAMGLIVNKPARDLSFDKLADQLGIARTDACLIVNRRTFSREAPITTARLVHPGHRFQLDGQFMP